MGTPRLSHWTFITQVAAANVANHLQQIVSGAGIFVGCYYFEKILGARDNVILLVCGASDGFSHSLLVCLDSKKIVPLDSVQKDLDGMLMSPRRGNYGHLVLQGRVDMLDQQWQDTPFSISY